MKVVAIVVVLLAVVAGALLVQQRAGAQSEAQYARVASEVAQRQVRVRCQGRLGAILDVGVNAGTVQFDANGNPADETHLTRAVCRGLRRFADDPRSRELDCVRSAVECPDAAFDTVEAVHTLAHEAVHLAGVRNEAEAECYGLQTIDLVAVRLGADRRTARALADYALARLYPSLPPHYRTDECRDGGPLDLVPGSAVFPYETVVGMSAISPAAICSRAASTASVAAAGTVGLGRRGRRRPARARTSRCGRPASFRRRSARSSGRRPSRPASARS